MRKHPLMLMFSGIFILIFLLTGVALGLNEAHRRHKLSYRFKQSARRLQSLFT